MDPKQAPTHPYATPPLSSASTDSSQSCAPYVPTEADLCALLAAVDVNAKPVVQLKLAGSGLYQRRFTR